jgi:hypothetical protein
MCIFVIMSNTTNIDDLGPTSSQQNVTMNINPQQGTPPPNIQSQIPPPHQGGQQNSGNPIHNMNAVLQNEQLNLPSRDIPMNPNSIQSDPHIQQNYVPPPQPNHNDYLKDYERLEAMMEQKQKEVEKKDKMDTLLEEIQQPFMAALVFMIFSLPIVNQKLRLIIPSLFLEDGNITIFGMVVKSLMFMVSLFVLDKSMVYLAE